jgi:hypothetical protein
MTISRAAISLTYPSQFMLAAAMNPCPCGHYGDSQRRCSCTSVAVQKYLERVSGPLLDRIDLHMEVPALRYRDLADERSGEPSEAIRGRVARAREVQRARFAGQADIHANAHMAPRDIRRFCAIGEGSDALLRTAISRLGLSARAYHRVLKIARTYGGSTISLPRRRQRPRCRPAETPGEGGFPTSALGRVSPLPRRDREVAAGDDRPHFRDGEMDVHVVRRTAYQTRRHRGGGGGGATGADVETWIVPVGTDDASALGAGVVVDVPRPHRSRRVALDLCRGREVRGRGRLLDLGRSTQVLPARIPRQGRLPRHRRVDDRERVTARQDAERRCCCQ